LLVKGYYGLWIEKQGLADAVGKGGVVQRPLL